MGFLMLSRVGCFVGEGLFLTRGKWTLFQRPTKSCGFSWGSLVPFVHVKRIYKSHGKKICDFEKDPLFHLTPSLPAVFQANIYDVCRSRSAAKALGVEVKTGEMDEGGRLGTIASISNLPFPHVKDQNKPQPLLFSRISERRKNIS